MVTTAMAELCTQAPSQKTVLVVDDDPAMLRIIDMILRRTGVRVKQAISGPAALEILRQQNTDVDLVISDVLMPDMEGSELMQQAQKERPNCQFLFCSGYAERIDEFANSEGEVPTLAKPFSPDQLRAVVTKLLQAPLN
jgi:CheY-like chemotaxis protein